MAHTLESGHVSAPIYEKDRALRMAKKLCLRIISSPRRRDASGLPDDPIRDADRNSGQNADRDAQRQARPNGRKNSRILDFPSRFGAPLTEEGAP